MSPDRTAQIWTAWVGFLDGVREMAREYTSEQECSDIMTGLSQAPSASTASVLTPEQKSADIDVLLRYWQIPMHFMAANSLNHCDLSPMLLSRYSVPLRDIMQLFGRHGKVACGRVWLRLLDVADAANPDTVQSVESRRFIQHEIDQVSTGSVATSATQQASLMNSGTNNNLPNGFSLDSIVSGALASFPGLADCVQQIISGAGLLGNATTADSSGNGTNPEHMNAVIDQVQDTLLKPILESLGNNPAVNNIQPAITQIISGFKELNSILGNSTTPSPLPWFRACFFCEPCFSEP